MTVENQDIDPTEEPAENDTSTFEPDRKTRSGDLTITLRCWYLYALVLPLIFVIEPGIGSRCDANRSGILQCDPAGDPGGMTIPSWARMMHL